MYNLFQHSLYVIHTMLDTVDTMHQLCNFLTLLSIKYPAASTPALIKNSRIVEIRAYPQLHKDILYFHPSLINGGKGLPQNQCPLISGFSSTHTNLIVANLVAAVIEFIEPD